MTTPPLDPARIAAWRERIADLRARHAALSQVPEVVGAAEVHAHVGFALGQLDQVVVALGHIAEVGEDAAEEADLLVLARALAPRLAPFANEDQEVDNHDLLTVAATALDEDLPLFEDGLASMEAVVRAQDEFDVSRAELQQRLREHAASVAHMHKLLDQIEALPADPAVKAMLEQLLAHGGKLDAAPVHEMDEAQRLSATVLERAARLLERTRAALGELPD